MGIVGRNLFVHLIPKLALAPQSVTTTTVNGPDIPEPEKLGRQLMIVLLGGAIAGTVTGITCTVQGKKRSDGTYVALKQSDGTTDLTFTATKLQDTAELETTGVLMGTIDISADYDGDTYSAIRITYTAGGTGAALIGALALIGDLYSQVHDAVDDLFTKAHG